MRMFRIKYPVAALLIMFTTSCYTDKECLCTDVYEPVCAEDGQTYRNSCEADCKDLDYIDGECPVVGIGEVIQRNDSLCEFLIRIAGELYKPDTIPPEYEIDGKWLSLRYRKLNVFFVCAEVNNHYRTIQVLKIDELIN